MKENLKGVFIEKEEKDKQNDYAVQRALRGKDDHIVYDVAFPLIISKEYKILEIYRKNEEDYGESSELGNCKETISFKDEVPKTVILKFEPSPEEKDGYKKEVSTSLSLEELEKELLNCNDEEDIDNLQE